MKRTLFFIAIISLSFLLHAQDKPASKLTFKDVKKLKSKKEFKEEIIISRPNQSAEMKRKETQSTIDMKININERIKKSNKLLY